MTSPLSNFIFVDKSRSVNATPVLKTTQHTTYIPQQQQQATVRNQSTIGNEEYVSGGSNMITTAGHVNYIKTGNLINNAQVIQFVSDEQAALIQQYQPAIIECSPEKIIRSTINQVGTHVITTVVLKCDSIYVWLGSVRIMVLNALLKNQRSL